MNSFFASNEAEEGRKGDLSGGIVFSHGAEWREQRRFALKTLRDHVREYITSCGILS